MIRDLGALLLVLLTFAGSANVLSCDQQKGTQHPRQEGTKRVPATAGPANQGSTAITNNEIKELAVGNHSTVFESFVLVARDAQTYAALRAMNSSLPEEGPDFFRSQTVVAAFLGQRRTGGYSVEIAVTGDGGVRVIEHSPGKGAMVTMALTAPFRIVALPLPIDQPLALSLDDTWKARLRPYRVTSGELSITGGFAGVNRRLTIEGSLSIMRAGALATFLFDIQATGDKQARSLRDAASGSVEASGSLSLKRIEAFALTGAIGSPFKATGQFTDNEQNLTLSFETQPASNVSDNFQATGSIKAIAVAPSPPDRAITGDN